MPEQWDTCPNCQQPVYQHNDLGRTVNKATCSLTVSEARARAFAEAQREAAQAVLDAVEATYSSAADSYVRAARAAAAKYGAGTAEREAERTEPHNCDGCVDLALAANNTRLPRRSDGHFVDCAAAGGDGR